MSRFAGRVIKKYGDTEKAVRLRCADFSLCASHRGRKPVIAFGDFTYYNIGDRGTRSFAELRELYAGNGMVGFVAKERVDGKLVLPEAVQVLKMGA